MMQVPEIARPKQCTRRPVDKAHAELDQFPGEKRSVGVRGFLTERGPSEHSSASRARWLPRTTSSIGTAGPDRGRRARQQDARGLQRMRGIATQAPPEPRTTGGRSWRRA